MPYYTDDNRYFHELELHGSLKKVLFEGDSWFSIPDIANIPIQIDSKCDLSILCLAYPGDTLEDISEGRQFIKLTALIEDNRFGQQWDALCLSAGANDIVGPNLKKLLKNPGNASTNPYDYLIPAELERRLAQVKDRLLKIIAMRDASKINQELPILVHSYAYMTPRNVAHQVLAWKVAGPWVYPYMVAVGITDCSLQQNIARILLNSYLGIIFSIANTPNTNFHVIDIRSALAPVTCEERDTDFSLWRDELHPTSKGFAQITEIGFIPALRKLGIC